MSVEGITSKPSAPPNRPKAAGESRADTAGNAADAGAPVPDASPVAGDPVTAEEDMGGIDPKVAALVRNDLTAQDALALAAGLTEALAGAGGAIANANPGTMADRTSA